MIGPFKKAPGGYDHILVVIDKFTKWIEVKPIKKHTAAKTIEFFEDITHRFGVPNRIITDNGTNFTAYQFKDWCVERGIKLYMAAVANPKSNGQVEKANGAILKAVRSRIYKKLQKYAGRWLKELPAVIWGLRT
ncbi:unnamed protein product [Urochloa humidicola]